MDEEKKNDTPEDTAPEDTAQEDTAQEDTAEDAAGGDVLAIVSELNDKIDAILVMLRDASADKASRFEQCDEPAKPASLY